MKRHDVAIIGGGPAGSTAGAVLGAAGRDAVILEKSRFPRFQIGESLLPWNMRIFDRLGVTSRLKGTFIDKRGVTFVSSPGDLERTIHFEQALDARYPCAFQVKRGEFDRILLENAEAKGARVRQGVRVAGARRENGAWSLELEPEGGPVETIQALWLVDASGREGFLASRGRRRELDPCLRKAALFAHMRGVDRPGGSDAGNIVIITLKDGWIWLIPFADGSASVGVVADGPRLGGGASREERFLEALRLCPAARDRTRSAALVSPVMGASDWTYTARAIAEEGALLAGDAAAFVDPIFSSGVLLAMTSGEAAATLLDESLARGGADPRRWAEYERSVLRHVAVYRRMVDLFYTPAFARLTFHPRTLFNLPGAVMSLLAGQVEPGWPVRWRLGLFYALGAIFNRLGAGTPVELHRVFQEALGPSEDRTRAA